MVFLEGYLVVIKLDELYRGKAKNVFQTDDVEHYILHFRDDVTAFDGEKHAELKRKGMVNNYFNAFIMSHLSEAGIETHFVKRLNNNESVVKRLEMIKVECVVRNYAAGSLCKRLGLAERTHLSPPLFEFFLKDDALHDPLINREHIRLLQLASEVDVEQMQSLTLQVNDTLFSLFKQAGLLLVDFKCEFGRYDGRIILGDEFTPDACRIWDEKTFEKLDKDRFRQDLGDVIESYEIVASRLGIELA